MRKRKHDDSLDSADEPQLPSATAFLIHCALFGIYTMLSGGQPESLALLIISGTWSLALFIHGIVLFQQHTVYRMAQRSAFHKPKKRNRSRLFDDEEFVDEDTLPDRYADVAQRDEERF